MPTRTQQSDVLLAAYASHGDTKHPLLFPATPRECFEMTADAFDLTERLQTPVIVMTDLDLGMNDHITDTLVWDDRGKYDRGKVLSSEQLETIYAAMTNSNGEGPLPGAIELDALTNDNAAPEQPLEQFRGKFGRYLDIDEDGVPYRTIPGVHATKGAFVTRGSSRDEYAVYTEDNEVYRRNMDRLLRKWETAKELVPQPEIRLAVGGAPSAVIYFGTSTFAAEEALELLTEEEIYLDAMRVRAFPFSKSFRSFVDAHERVFVIEQNRDAQLRSLLTLETDVPKSKLRSILHYSGLPMTSKEIVEAVVGEIGDTRQQAKLAQA